MNNNINVEETKQICKGGSKKGVLITLAGVVVTAIVGGVGALLYKKHLNKVEEVECVDVDCEEANIEE